MNRNKIIGSIVSVIIILASVVTASAFEKKVYLNEGFGNYATNARDIEGFTSNTGDGFIVVEFEKNNKGLKFNKKNAASIGATFDSAIMEDYLVVSAYIKSYESLPTLNINLKNGTTQYSILNIQNGKVVMNDKKELGLLACGKTVRIDAVIDCRYGRITVYSQGKQKIAQWKISGFSNSYTGIEVVQQSNDVEFVLDNLAVYAGKKPDMSILDKKYSDKAISSLYIEQDGSDYTYFHSHYISSERMNYPNTSFSARTGNSYYAEALQNYTDIEKDDRIILTKTTDDTSYSDVYFGVDIASRAYLFPDPAKKYKSYAMSTDIIITDTSVGGWPLMLRDSSTGTNRDFYLRMINGALYDHNNKKLSETFDINRKYHIECYIDMSNHSYDVYLDGELIGENCKFPDNINELRLFRVVLDKGKGSWIIENMEFKGLAVPYKRKTDMNGKTVPDVVRSSQFADNTPIREYLKDITVFHGDGQLLYKNSEKIPFESEAVYENNELYVSQADFNKAFDTNIKFDEKQQKYIDGKNGYSIEKPKEHNGILLYPAKALSTALGYAAKNSWYGNMVLVADSTDNLIEFNDQDRPWFDSIFYNVGSLSSKTMRFTDVQEISNYIFYDRPDAEKIKEDFFKTLGETPSHPRLLIDSDDVARLRDLYQNDEYVKNMANQIIQSADVDAMNRPLIQFVKNGYNTKGNAEKFQLNETIAFAYVMTGDKKYADRAIEQLMQVSTFPEIHLNHVIDAGVWLKPIAIIYDWCYDAMTDEQRKQIQQFIYEKGIEPLNRAYYGQLSAAVYGTTDTFHASFFPTWKSNFTAFVQGGLVPACLSVAEYYPDYAFDTLEKAIRAYEYMLMGYYPNGVWLEGKTYQSVNNKYNAMALGSMLKCLDTDYKLMSYPGVHDSLHAMMSYGSLSGSFTFADDSHKAALGGIDGSYQFYANIYDDPVLSLWRQLKAPNKYSEKYALAGNRNDRYDYFDVIYYEPMPDESVLRNFKNVEYYEGGEIFTVHENWLDKNALFFAAAGGPTNSYHFHYDMGDFQFNKDGINWIYEFGQGNYSVGDVRTRFGSRSEGHNTITINNTKGVSQKEDSFVPVTKYEEGEAGAYVVYDMKEVYAHHGTEKMDRGFYIGDNYESLRIRDEMSFSKEVTGYWHLHTDANVTQFDEHTVLLAKGGKKLFLRADYEAEGFKTELSVNKARPLPESPVLSGDKQNNTNVNQIRIKFVGKGDINITVELYDDIRDIVTSPISEWLAPERKEVIEDNTDYSFDLYYKNGEKINSIDTIPMIDGEYPEFEVRARNSEMTAEVVSVVQEPERPMLVKISNADGSKLNYSLVKYSEFGEVVKDLLYEDVEIKDYWVSSEPEPENHKENMFDNDLSTRLTMFFDNETATFDLGETKQVDGLALAVWKGTERNYYLEIQVSDDGKQFRTVGEYSSSGRIEDYEFYTFPTEKARYVRFVGHMNSAGNANNILELRVIKRK